MQAASAGVVARGQQTKNAIPLRKTTSDDRALPAQWPQLLKNTHFSALETGLVPSFPAPWLVSIQVEEGILGYGSFLFFFYFSIPDGQLFLLGKASFLTFPSVWSGSLNSPLAGVLSQSPPQHIR